MFVQSDLAPSNLRDLKWLLSVDGSSTYALDGCRNGMHFFRNCGKNIYSAMQSIATTIKTQMSAVIKYLSRKAASCENVYAFFRPITDNCKPVARPQSFFCCLSAYRSDYREIVMASTYLCVKPIYEYFSIKCVCNVAKKRKLSARRGGRRQGLQ